MYNERFELGKKLYEDLKAVGLRAGSSLFSLHSLGGIIGGLTRAGIKR